MAHRTARLNGFGRQLLVDRVIVGGWTVATASAAQGISRATGHKWVRRFRLEGPSGLLDRSSRPHRSPRATPAHEVQRIIAARLEWRWGPDRLGPLLGQPPSTVGAVLRRVVPPCMADIDRPTGLPVRRYEVCHPGALVHQDLKKLGRIPDGGGHRVLGHRSSESRAKPKLGYDHFEVIVDDRSRRSVVVHVPDETGASAAAALAEALAVLRADGITVERVLTDNGLAYRSNAYQSCPGRSSPDPDPAVPAADQRQGRTIHRDACSRVGLCPALSLQRRATRRAAGLRRLLQSAPPAHRARWTLTLGRCQQRPW